MHISPQVQTKYLSLKKRHNFRGRFLQVWLNRFTYMELCAALCQPMWSIARGPKEQGPATEERYIHKVLESLFNKQWAPHVLWRFTSAPAPQLHVMWACTRAHVHQHSADHSSNTLEYTMLVHKNVSHNYLSGENYLCPAALGIAASDGPVDLSQVEGSRMALRKSSSNTLNTLKHLHKYPIQTKISPCTANQRKQTVNA